MEEKSLSFQSFSDKFWLSINHRQKHPSRSVVDFIALHPSAGDLIPDSGGLRKLRWARDGKGKRGGVRVFYYFRDLNMALFLLAIYGKGEKSPE